MAPAFKSLFAKTRTLDQAAQAAREIAAAEHLPISASYGGNPEEWHRKAILKTVPVYGMRERRRERIPAAARLAADHAEFESDTWSDLKVKSADFQRYLEWLHSLW